MSALDENEAISKKFKEIDDRCEKRNDKLNDKNQEITKLKEQFKNLEKRVQKTEDLHQMIFGMQKDISYNKEGITEIKEILSKQKDSWSLFKGDMGELVIKWGIIGGVIYAVLTNLGVF